VTATLSQGSVLKERLQAGARYLAYLPLAHIMELAVEVALLCAGLVLGYGSPHTLTPTSVKMLHTNQEGDAQALKPDFLVAAPAVLDKVYAAVSANFRKLTGVVKCIVDGGIASGAANFERGEAGASGCLAPLLFKKKVASLLGGNVKLIITGSAPLGPEMQKFVQTVFACPVRQGYGLTETMAGSCITATTDNATSVVGPPQECACIRLRDWEEGGYRAADLHNPEIARRRGEVLIGGPMVCAGYLTNPEMPDPEVEAKNKEEFVTIDGVRYFCTGDIGQYTPTGNLQVIDRKKDLVKLQQGEYVALSKVENALKASRFTALPMVYARSSMSYCIALVCPNEAELRKLDVLPEGSSLKELCAHRAVIDAVTADVKAVCKQVKLAAFETPTKVILIEELFTPENGMLTAVNKLKRKDIEAQYKAAIDKVYV